MKNHNKPVRQSQATYRRRAVGLAAAFGLAGGVAGLIADHVTTDRGGVEVRVPVTDSSVGPMVCRVTVGPNQGIEEIIRSRAGNQDLRPVTDRVAALNGSSSTIHGQGLELPADLCNQPGDEIGHMDAQGHIEPVEVVGPDGSHAPTSPGVIVPGVEQASN